MKHIACLTAAAAAMAGGILYMASALGQTDGDASPIYGIKIPAGYRDWRLISVKQLTGNKLKQLRAQLGNDIAIEAFREGKLPFPDGAIIAALHWNEASSDLDNQVLAAGFRGAGLESSFRHRPSKGHIEASFYFRPRSSKSTTATDSSCVCPCPSKGST